MGISKITHTLYLENSPNTLGYGLRRVRLFQRYLVWVILTNALTAVYYLYNSTSFTQMKIFHLLSQLLSEESFQKYLERGLRRAESSAANSFHCKTTDCRGFCFYEDNNNFFNCPLCKRINCLTCKAIHEGIDCKQYQEDLKTRAQNDVSARQTQETLEVMYSSLLKPVCTSLARRD